MKFLDLDMQLRIDFNGYIASSVRRPAKKWYEHSNYHVSKNFGLIDIKLAEPVPLLNLMHQISNIVIRKLIVILI